MKKERHRLLLFVFSILVASYGSIEFIVGFTLLMIIFHMRGFSKVIRGIEDRQVKIIEMIKEIKKEIYNLK